MTFYKKQGSTKTTQTEHDDLFLKETRKARKAPDDATKKTTLNSKFIMMNKPGQSMKTFWQIEKMRMMQAKLVQLYPNFRNTTIHVAFCNNRILETLQLKERLEQHFEDCVILYSKSKTCKLYEQLYHAITVNNKRRIIMCTNKTRVNDLTRLFEELPRTNANFEFHIWFDEMDANIKLLAPLIDKWGDRPEVKSITCITGTNEKLYERYDNINVIPLDKSHDDKYLGLKDHKYEIVPAASSSPADYVESVLSANKHCITDKTNWFVPAGIAKKSHKAVAEILTSYGFVTLIINGDGIAVHKPDGSEVMIDKTKITGSIANEIPKIMREHNPMSKPSAITGNKCIERGVTLMSADYLFTHAIIPAGMDGTKATQTIWRTCGQFKNLKKDQIVVYTTSDTLAKVMNLNEIALHIAKLAYDLKQTNNDSETVAISKEQTITLGNSTQARKQKPKRRVYRFPQTAVLEIILKDHPHLATCPPNYANFIAEEIKTSKRLIVAERDQDPATIKYPNDGRVCFVMVRPEVKDGETSDAAVLKQLLWDIRRSFQRVLKKLKKNSEQ